MLEPTETDSGLVEKRLVLASRSPRRADLLRQLHLSFDIFAIDIDERFIGNETISDYALRLSEQKAHVAWQHYKARHPLAPPPLILAADTCGEIDGQLLAKPKDFFDAKRILQQLSGKMHCIYSAFSLYDGQRCHRQIVCSQVSFRPLSDAEIQRYWQTGEPQDKAGAYAIQGLAAQFITHLSGSYSAVMGLPLFELSQALTRFDFKVF